MILTTTIICIAWALSMWLIINIALSSRNYTFPQWKQRQRICSSAMIIITLMYIWVLFSMCTPQDDPHEELILSPASDKLIGSAWFLEHTIVDV